jgi:hypothetical protein
MNDNKQSFVAQGNCTLRGRRYRAGDHIEVTFASWPAVRDFTVKRSGEAGPWGYGGYTSRAISAAALKIEDY